MPSWMKRPDELAQEKKDGLIKALEALRENEENKPLVVNGISFRGSPSYRATVKEAVDSLTFIGQNEVADWKDSEGVWHKNVSLETITNGLIAVMERRQALFSKQALFKGQVEAGTLTDLQNIDWSLEEGP